MIERLRLAQLTYRKRYPAIERHGEPLGQISDFEVRLIRVLRAVVESGGFTAAVPALGSVVRQSVFIWLIWKLELA